MRPFEGGFSAERFIILEGREDAGPKSALTSQLGGGNIYQLKNGQGFLLVGIVDRSSFEVAAVETLMML